MLPGRPTVKLSAQIACGGEAVDADVEQDLVVPPDPKPAVFPRRLTLRAERLALKIGRVFQRINAPAAFLRSELTLGSHLAHEQYCKSHLGKGETFSTGLCRPHAATFSGSASTFHPTSSCARSRLPAGPECSASGC